MPKRAPEGGDDNPAPQKKADVAVEEPSPVANASANPASVSRPNPVCKHPGADATCCLPCIQETCIQRKADLAACEKALRDAEKALEIATNLKRSPWVCHTCDGCGKRNPKGYRYSCTVCTDMDFCEECNANDCHMIHSLVQIKYRHQKGPGWVTWAPKMGHYGEMLH